MKLAGVEGNTLKEIKRNSVKELVKADNKALTKNKEKKSFKEYFTLENLEERVEKYNKIFTEEDINIYLDVRESNKKLSLRVIDREDNETVRIFNEEEIGEVLRKLDDLLGIIVDKLV